MNERSIFSRSTGEVAQVGQRRVAGAEVVEREAHADRRAAARARSSARSGSLAIMLSVISSSSALRREAVAREHLGDDPRQPAVQQAARREVDGEVEVRRPSPSQTRTWRQRVVEHARS